MKHLICCLLVILFTSCGNLSQSGNYIIVQVTNDSSMQMATRNIIAHDEVIQQLQSAFIGKSFYIDFEDDYITFKSPNSKLNNLLFTNIEGHEGIRIWKAMRMFGRTEMTLFLKEGQQGLWNLGINYRAPREQPVFIPAQFGAKLESQDPDKHAMVIFSLKKIAK